MQLSLTSVKLLHTVAWALIVGCILGIPLAACRGRFKTAGSLSAVVLIECAILAVNHGRCPLTDFAARLTTNLAYNFDIFLPLWLARWNKLIFGALFLVSIVFALMCWKWRRSELPPRRADPDAGVASQFK